MKKEGETRDPYTKTGRTTETDTEIHKETDGERNKTYSRHRHSETRTHRYRGGYTEAEAHRHATDLERVPHRGHT